AIGVEGNVDTAAPNDSTHNLGFTAGSGYLVFPGNGTLSGNSGNKNDSIHPEYRVVTSAGTYKADGVLNTNANGKWAAGLATYLTDLTDHYRVTTSANPVTAGTSFTVTVTAMDVNNNPFSGHLGTVTVTNTDAPAAGLS